MTTTQASLVLASSRKCAHGISRVPSAMICIKVLSLPALFADTTTPLRRKNARIAVIPSSRQAMSAVTHHGR